MYLTGVTKDEHRQTLIDMGVGLISQPGSYNAAEAARWPVKAYDNGCYKAGESWEPEPFLEWLDTNPRDGVLFATAPDYFTKPNGALTDHHHTLARSMPHLSTIREMGFPVAFVLQLGVTLDTVPWEDIDAVFIGGGQGWKHSSHVVELCQEARKRGLWVHVGRANSYRSLSLARVCCCQSGDGTFMKHGPDINIKRLQRWLQKLEMQPELPLYSDWTLVRRWDSSKGER